MGSLYQITKNGEHVQTCYAYDDTDALEIAQRWFHEEPPHQISTSPLEPNENGSHLQTYMEK